MFFSDVWQLRQNKECIGMKLSFWDTSIILGSFSVEMDLLLITCSKLGFVKREACKYRELCLRKKLLKRGKLGEETERK